MLVTAPNSSKATRVCKQSPANLREGHGTGHFQRKHTQRHEIHDKQMLPNVIQLTHDTERSNERDWQRSAKKDRNAAETDANAS